MRTTVDDVRAFWNAGPCQSDLSLAEERRRYFQEITDKRYAIREWHVPTVAKFGSFQGKDVLEIGVGMGANHVEWARSRPLSLTGIDLTARAVDHVKQRFDTYGLKSDIFLGDAENLPFLSKSFDIVYSWGVIHRTPDTQAAI